MVDTKLLEIMVCPSCQGDLEEGHECLTCKACGLRYPVRNGVPIMLIEEAEKPEKK